MSGEARKVFPAYALLDLPITTPPTLKRIGTASRIPSACFPLNAGPLQFQWRLDMYRHLPICRLPYRLHFHYVAGQPGVLQGPVVP